MEYGNGRKVKSIEIYIKENCKHLLLCSLHFDDVFCLHNILVFLSYSSDRPQPPHNIHEQDIRERWAVEEATAAAVTATTVANAHHGDIVLRHWRVLLLHLTCVGGDGTPKRNTK